MILARLGSNFVGGAINRELRRREEPKGPGLRSDVCKRSRICGYKIKKDKFCSGILG